MNKFIFITLLLLTPLLAQAECYVIPLTTDQLTARTPPASPIGVSGQIIRGEGCRGVGANSIYTADQYSFYGHQGDTVVVKIDQAQMGQPYDGQIDLVDQTDAIIAHTTGPIPVHPSDPEPLSFTIQLPSSGLYKLIITGLRTSITETSTNETVYYIFYATSSNPLQPTSARFCPSDKFRNGVLTLNSINVSNEAGGVDHYRVNLDLQPASNPAVFSVKSAELIQ